MFNRLISQLTRRSAAALPAESTQARAVTHAWLAADLFPSYVPELLFADPLRERVAGLIAGRTEIELIEPLLDQLDARGAQPVDRMLRADAWLAAGAVARAEPLLAELALLEDGIGARAAAMLAQRLIDRGDYAAARPLAGRAERLAPDSVGTQTALGYLRDFEGRLDLALVHFQRALALRPDHAVVVGDLATAHLARGELREGLSVWALADEINGAHAQADLCPVWDGRPLGGDSLLIVCGYGFGDILQFMRFALHLRAREAAARLCILVPPPLARLASAMGCFASVHTAAPDRAVFDWQISLTRL
ncbi:MAG TPA: hypothetical protein VH105_06375, partial [Burkholderiales bacterium]|nr:hypothetical protein [Burkholderiales bacterium]